MEAAEHLQPLLPCRLLLLPPCPCTPVLLLLLLLLLLLPLLLSQSRRCNFGGGVGWTCMPCRCAWHVIKHV